MFLDETWKEEMVLLVPLETGVIESFLFPTVPEVPFLPSMTALQFTYLVFLIGRWQLHHMAFHESLLYLNETC